jgi:two-component system, NtrC family, sensor kinase
MPEENRVSPPSSRLATLYNSVSLRLFLLLFGVVVVGVAAHAFVSSRSTSAQWMDFLEQSANRTSELIKKGTYYGMLLNRKEEIHRTIVKIAQTPGVAGVRIYDKHGVVIFSADPAEIGRRVDLQAEACVVCHDRAEPLHSVPVRSRTRVYRGPDGGRILGVTSSIENQPDCANAACHAHRADQTVLGVLDVTLSLSSADERMRAQTRELILSTLLLVAVIGATSALFIYRVVRVPVERLIEGTARVARGDLDTRIDVGTPNQIGQLAESFNAMTGDLRAARQELTRWSEKLEKKIAETTEELSRAHRQIVQMEKMASLGKLSATVAHELNNPLAGILTYAKLVGRSLHAERFDPGEREEVARYLDLIRKESRRCGDIVKNLLVFARVSGGEFALEHLDPILERAIMLVRHHLEIKGIRLESSGVEGDDTIVCDADQIQQALLALLVNAVEAMPKGGTLTLRAADDRETVRIDVSDTGVGIPPEVLLHVFEPFFSTKEGGAGVGLGLSVVYGIVERHGGSVTVDSTVGRGTTFTLRFPRKLAVPEAGVDTGPGRRG